jgi:hypothetical protein
MNHDYSKYDNGSLLICYEQYVIEATKAANGFRRGERALGKEIAKIKTEVLRRMEEKE